MSKEELVEIQSLNPRTDMLWQPVVGDETLTLIDSQNNLSPQEKTTLKNESLSILAQCVAPTEPDRHHSGLIVGNIQSGKTLSFATVTALARDNRYQLVIIITGTAKILNSQSVKRLTTLLRIGSRRDFAWQMLRNPGLHSLQIQKINAVLQDWKLPTNSGLKQQTLIITVLKHAGRLRSLARLLENLDLRGVPALVIDDEADQAGLNTAAKQESKSPTYRELRNIRNTLPHHTYLGYTATPQAPLLINIMDVLSAKFAKVLTPGAEYTGGKQFFEYHPSLIRTIPDTQVPSKNNPLNTTPESMIDALRLFFIGVAAGILPNPSSQREAGNRSMLIHPSRLTAQHTTFIGWVQSLKASWTRLLESEDLADNQDKEDLILDFRQAYDDLKQTKPDIPTFDQILPVLRQAIMRTDIYEINQRPSNQFTGFEDIDEFWGNNYSYILVGGQSLERGFTIEGLTVTYMPRSIGTGQADTIQQRARFYGYNNKHLGYCRVYLDAAARDAYQGYIDHEDQLRDSLAKHAAAGKPLNEWRRAFFLDASLKPTRDNVLDIDYTRGAKANIPYAAMPPIYSTEDLNINRQLIEEFISGLQLQSEDQYSHLPSSQKHKVARNIRTQEVFENLIVPLRINDHVDSWNYLQIRLQIQRFLESNPEAFCTVYRMRPGALEVERSLRPESDKIEAFQGANPSTGYEGDRSIFDQNILTIQIHRYSKIRDQNGNTLATDVCQVAVILPEQIALTMVAQNQGMDTRND